VNDFCHIKDSILAEVSLASERALLEQIEISGDTSALTVVCPSGFSKQYIANEYRSLIETCVRRHMGVVDLSFGVQGSRVAKSQAAKPMQMMLPEATRALPLELNRGYTFDEFVVGKCNAFAFEAARAVAEDGIAMHSPLYFYSDIGLGKSHLAHAIGNQVVASGSKRRIRYTTARDFSQDYVHAVMNNSLDGFKSRYAAAQSDILFIDDVHLLQKKEKTQMELCCIIDEMMGSGRQVILSGYRQPSALTGMDKGLLSRFASGLVIDLKRPDKQTKAKIVRHKALKQGVCLPENVVEYICDNINTNVRELESAVLSVTVMASLMRREVSLELAREALAGKLQKRQKLDIAFIQDFVARNFDLSRDLLVSASRKKNIVYPRQVAIFLCRRYTDESLQLIGEAFNRKHSSVIHALEVIDNRYSQNLAARKEIDYLVEKLEGELA